MVTVDDNLYSKMPKEVQECFYKLPNPGSDEVEAVFPQTKTGGSPANNPGKYSKNGMFAQGATNISEANYTGDSGSASRFFYTAKASKSERNAGLEGFEKGCTHPTVKPVKLMQYLVRLVTPKGGTVLDPFNGSGTTGIACKLEGFDYIGIELDPEYVKISEARIKAWEVELEQVKLV